MPNLYLILWIVLTLIPSIFLIFLLIQEVRRARELKSKLEEILHRPPPPVVGEQAVKKGEELIHNAGEKAEQIISDAQHQSIQIAAQAKIATQSFESMAQKNLMEFLKDAETRYQKYLETLGTQGQLSQQQLEETLKVKINESLFNFDQHLSEFLHASEQKSLEALNLEIKSARQLIESYKQQQLQIIDENIVAVLERTLSLVLRNKLTLKDQMDLVYEGLEKAKVEKFFA